MLQAMNTGHDGSMSTIHANSPRDAMARMESLVQYSASILPLPAIRRQIAGALDFIVHIERDPAGRRLITEIIEITGMEGDTITSQPIFVRDMNFGEPSVGALIPSGLVPKSVDRFAKAGLDFPPGHFSKPKPE